MLPVAVGVAIVGLACGGLVWFKNSRQVAAPSASGHVDINVGSKHWRVRNGELELTSDAGEVITKVELAREHDGGVSLLKVQGVAAQSSDGGWVITVNEEGPSKKKVSGIRVLEKDSRLNLALQGDGTLLVGLSGEGACMGLPEPQDPYGARNVGCIRKNGAILLKNAIPAPPPTWPNYTDIDSPRYALSTNPELEVGPSAALFENTLKTAGQTTATLKGKVTPAREGIKVIAVDAQGRTVAASFSDNQGAFALTGANIARVFATLGTTRLGPIMAAKEGVSLPVSAMGRLSLKARDHDTNESLPVRFVVHGIEGAREPNFGADSRATGAGPLVDAEAGTFSTLLPAGRYQVLATRGVEYSIDRQVVEVKAGEETTAHLSVRREVDTPGWAGCDFHVHSRGSFDSLVSVEDRVRSLAAAGVDFAIPSEHNHVGTYAAVDTVGLSDRLAWAPGVEVTTVDPMRGHFNVFPYSLEAVPSYRKTTLNALIKFVRSKSPDSVIQINHPRLDAHIGYFDASHIDPATEQGRGLLPKGFDAIEVYNGFDLGALDRVEEVLKDWVNLHEAGRHYTATGNSDSHSVQYVWAGYPRTYVKLADDHEDGKGAAITGAAVATALRSGHAIVTDGPIIDLTQGDHGPGDALVVENGAAKIHVRVRAPDWIDVRKVEVIVGGKVAFSQDLDERPSVAGTPQGTLEEARKHAVRFEADVDVKVPASVRSVFVLVRGNRLMNDILPFTEFKPFAFSNPLLRR